MEQAHLKNSLLFENDVWLKTKEVSELLNISKQAISKKIKTCKCNFKFRRMNNNGGEQYEFLLSSLPVAAQKKYCQSILQNKEESKTENLTADGKEIELEIFNEVFDHAPQYNKDLYLRRKLILSESDGLKGEQFKNFLCEWNKKHPDYKTSVSRVYEWKKKLKELGPIGLLGNYGKNNGNSKITNEDFEYFKTLYLKEGAPTLNTCWYSTFGNAIKNNAGVVDENFPSGKTFLRRLEKEVPKQAIYFARYGERKWNRKYASYINRDYTDIRAGQVWVSDHRQLDQAVMRDLPNSIKNEVEFSLVYQQLNFTNKKSNNKPTFPWLTVWRDFLTGKWLGWDLHLEDPNADHIFQSFYNATINFGLPEEIYIDNGKDYRCKDFAGGKRTFRLNVDEVKTRSMMAALNIKVHFAQPYNGQSKPLERDFRNFKDWCDKGLPGYRGGNIVERPEVLNENIKKGKLIHFVEYTELINFFITNIINKYRSSGKNLLGKSPDQVWNEEQPKLRMISEDALKMFCMRTSNDLTIGRNGITVNHIHNLYYWADWMFSAKGKKVYIRRDNKKYQEAWVFDSATNEYLGKAFLNAWNCNAQAKTDLEKQKLTDLLKSRKNEKKIIKEYIRTDVGISPEEYLGNLSAGIAALSTPIPTEQVTEKKAVIFVKTKMDEVIRQERLRSTGTDGINFDNYKPLKPKKKEPRDWF